MEELLSLKWNNHRSTFLHILTILRDKQLYTDATLACEGRFYSVHRLVLSTCSDYFSAMFDRTTCKNPIIVLKDIKCEDLEALLDYMYLGEVNVRQADLASLIKAAECLRVKGLAVPDDEPPPKRGRGDTNFRKPDSAGSPPSKRKRREEGTQDGREDIRPAPAQPKVGSQSQASRLSPGPQDPSDSSKLQPQTTSSSSADMLQPNNVPQSDEQQSPFVKVEMEDSGGDDMGGGGVGADNSFNMNNDSFKEEASEDHVGDLSNDLPEFLQQSTDGSYSHSFAGPSFQPDLPNWQGDQVLSSNNFSGLGFPSQSQDGSQNTGTSGSGTVRPRSDLVEIKCYVCGKEISGRNRRQKLQYHLMTHTNLRPHPCPVCPYRAHHRFTLYRHLRSVHREVIPEISLLLPPETQAGQPPPPPHPPETQMELPHPPQSATTSNEHSQP